MIIILVIGTIEKDIVVVVTKAVKKNEIYNIKFYIENEEKGPCLIRQIYYRYVEDPAPDLALEGVRSDRSFLSNDVQTL